MGARSSRNTTQNNRSDGHLLEYFRNTFVRGGGGTNAPNVFGLTATGGVISDYTSGPAVIEHTYLLLLVLLRSLLLVVMEILLSTLLLLVVVEVGLLLLHSLVVVVVVPVVLEQELDFQ